MKISVIVKARARGTSVEKNNDESFVVRVSAPPHDGQANEAVIKALADYFDIAPSRFSIISGYTSKKKIVNIQ